MVQVSPSRRWNRCSKIIVSKWTRRTSPGREERSPGKASQRCWRKATPSPCAMPRAGSSVRWRSTRRRAIGANALSNVGAYAHDETGSVGVAAVFYSRAAARNNSLTDASEFDDIAKIRMRELSSPHSAVSGETLAIFESSLRAAKISLELDIADKASKMRGGLSFVNFPDPL